jgi:hypothetical protein
MNSGERHQCLLYEGPPSQHLKAVAAVIREKLDENFRCLYLNSGPMVAGIRSYLAAAGVDVARETQRGSLVMTSERNHLSEQGDFNIDGMMQALSDALEQALRDRHAGLWATGDMTWEFGSERNFSKLLDYELRLEEFMGGHPELGGICQYHADTLPSEVMRQSLVTHRSIFVNETLSLLNPHFVPRGDSHAPPHLESAMDRELDGTVLRLCQQEM